MLTNSGYLNNLYIHRLLFYQIIKRNYAKKLFNQKQVELLLQLLEESKKTFISEDKYYEFDEQTYLNKLDAFPEEE